MNVRIPVRSAAVTAVAGAALLVPTSGAHAAIVLDESMGGVKLGATLAEVRAALGAPTTHQEVRDRNGSPNLVDYYKTTKVKVVYDRDPRQPWTARILVTRRGVERTPDRVGVGTPGRVLRKRIKGLSCFRYTSRLRLCATKGRSLGEIGLDQTQFEISQRTKRVTRVTVGRFYD